MMDCKGCGRCCGGPRFLAPISENEARSLPADSWTREANGLIRMATNPETGMCVMLDDATNLCRVYEIRPHACRVYPQRWPSCTEGNQDLVGRVAKA